MALAISLIHDVMQEFQIWPDVKLQNVTISLYVLLLFQG
jgi:hypothetical protein